MSERYTKAVCLAAEAHEGQFRKSTAIPYITHPVAVAGLVAKYGGDEDQQIAGLFHDVLEDGGPKWEPQVTTFGPRVLAIVKACTDGLPDESGQKAPWRQRKEAYLEYLKEETDDALLVSACSQLPTDQWYASIGENTLADAILDRIMHNAHRLQLKGESMRRKMAKIDGS